ncbi:hypothetical protein [Pelodictyon phaeoclathratiforme]|jgi:hypothetical protein|uniref:hypothetical protein n=1 Tax=Pelodictyon phaeoclathratiforme TaxID=34090 RepID=UPI001231C735|nr:hypothetical protein [Pelodictyon phaeoclathratiforme]MBV5290207.1 hypothetical protein [Pelodictyon phaeoclathratiforme]
MNEPQDKMIYLIMEEVILLSLPPDEEPDAPCGTTAPHAVPRPAPSHVDERPSHGGVKHTDAS